MTRTVLVTGGAGFIGSNLARFLRRERPEWKVVNLDKLTYAGNAESVADLRQDQGMSSSAETSPTPSWPST